MAKTNIGLVEYAKKALAEHWGYVWGTFGYVLTEALFKEKLKQYPNNICGYEAFIRANWIGKRTVDCIGLIKAYLWDNGSEVRYNQKQDVNVGGMVNAAKEKGPISTLPDIPGVLVHKKGHIGVYIGAGQVIESKGTKYGVVKTPLKEAGATPWSGWCKCPYIEYIEEQKAVEQMIEEISPWAKEAAAWVKEKGISDGARPKDTITREEVWTMLHRMRG